MDAEVKAEVDRIVSEGQNVRPRIRAAFESASKELGRTPTRLRELSRATIESATAAIDRAAPDDPDSVLRQVIDGLGEGLERTAEATKLALEEAGTAGKTYAADDLKNIGEELKAISEDFAAEVERGLSGAAGQTKDRARDLIAHAENTLKSIRPALLAAAGAAAKHPISLAGESAAAGVHLTREAAGALFSAVGDLLKSAGDRVSPAEGTEEAD